MHCKQSTNCRNALQAKPAAAMHCQQLTSCCNAPKAATAPTMLGAAKRPGPQLEHSAGKNMVQSSNACRCCLLTSPRVPIRLCSLVSNARCSAWCAMMFWCRLARVLHTSLRCYCKLRGPLSRPWPASQVQPTWPELQVPQVPTAWHPCAIWGCGWQWQCCSNLVHTAWQMCSAAAIYCTVYCTLPGSRAVPQQPTAPWMAPSPAAAAVYCTLLGRGAEALQQSTAHCRPEVPRCCSSLQHRGG